MKLKFCLLLGCLAICQPSLAQAQPIIPDGTTTIPDDAFYRRTDLTNVVIPDSVTNIGIGAFAACTNLTRITVGKGATTVAYAAFACMGYTDPERNPGGFPLTNAVSVCFTGNAPTNVDAHAFDTWTIVGSSGAYVSCNVTVYYLSGTTGWGTMLADRPTVCWGWHARITSLPRITHGGTYGTPVTRCIFTITGSSNTTVFVQGCTNLANPIWFPVQTVALPSDQFDFYDEVCLNSEWPGKHPVRFYRLGSP
jgi:hypothetical protein